MPSDQSNSAKRTRSSPWTRFVAAVAVVWLAGGVVCGALDQVGASYACSLTGGALVFLALYSRATDRMSP